MGTCCLESMVKILIGACYGRILHFKTFQSRQFFVQFCTFLLHSFSYRNSYSVRFLCITSFVFRSFCKFHRLQIHFASEFAATSSQFRSVLFAIVPFSVQLCSSHTTFVSTFAQFVSCHVFSSFHSCHLHSLVTFSFVFTVTTVILIRCYRNNKRVGTVGLFAI